MQDLIFKSGQAGIKKASVSLVFDNSNPERSPPGFEQVCEITVTRQVEIGGKTKYLLNGHVAQHKKVQDIFCSVQLNVNNPNFLVMQGKITKVLNMKPVEVNKNKSFNCIVFKFCLLLDFVNDRRGGGDYDVSEKEGAMC